jgi:hypothetical protein
MRLVYKQFKPIQKKASIAVRLLQCNFFFNNFITRTLKKSNAILKKKTAPAVGGVEAVVKDYRHTEIFRKLLQQHRQLQR